MQEQPLAHADRCVLELGELALELTRGVGGRVTSLRLGAEELLCPASVHELHFGSTFWTSPQSDWSWPPVPEVDSEAYDMECERGVCRLTSRRVSAPAHPVVDGVRIRKTFRVEPERNSLACEYAILNEGQRPKRLAPWEITRVAAGGLTFYASDEAPRSSGPFPITPVQHALGSYWFQHQEGFPKTKLCSDGQGWIAHVSKQRTLLLKRFEDVIPGEAAPGEGEIEIYSDLRYVEVENQGAYRDIPPGGLMSWTVRWYVRRVPSDIAVSAGSRELLAYVCAIIE